LSSAVFSRSNFLLLIWNIEEFTFAQVSNIFAFGTESKK
jgi:hypothetical protein